MGGAHKEYIGVLSKIIFHLLQDGYKPTSPRPEAPYSHLRPPLPYPTTPILGPTSPILSFFSFLDPVGLQTVDWAGSRYLLSPVLFKGPCWRLAMWGVLQTIVFSETPSWNQNVGSLAIEATVNIESTVGPYGGWT